LSLSSKIILSLFYLSISVGCHEPVDPTTEPEESLAREQPEDADTNARNPSNCPHSRRLGLSYGLMKGGDAVRWSEFIEDDALVTGVHQTIELSLLQKDSMEVRRDVVQDWVFEFGVNSIRDRAIEKMSFVMSVTVVEDATLDFEDALESLSQARELRTRVYKVFRLHPETGEPSKEEYFELWSEDRLLVGQYNFFAGDRATSSVFEAAYHDSLGLMNLQLGAKPHPLCHGDSAPRVYNEVSFESEGGEVRAFRYVPAFFEAKGEEYSLSLQEDGGQNPASHGVSFVVLPRSWVSL
jgi:hypothetical protein